jgi:hypothetical protein
VTALALRGAYADGEERPGLSTGPFFDVIPGEPGISKLHGETWALFGE